MPAPRRVRLGRLDPPLVLLKPNEGGKRGTSNIAVREGGVITGGGGVS